MTGSYRNRPRAIALVLAVGLAMLPASVTRAEEQPQSGAKRTKRTVGEAVRTGGHAARDGVLTFGRSTKAFFTGGTAAARSTWNENAHKTRDEAKAGAGKTRAAAHGK